MRVRQLINRNGNANANQFVIEDGDRTLFQSYDSLCAIVEPKKITFGLYWDYSRTTMKHLNKFLEDCGIPLTSASEIRKAIKNGKIANTLIEVFFDEEIW